jgi:hypothetical protein
MFESLSRKDFSGYVPEAMIYIFYEDKLTIFTSCTKNISLYF